MTESEAVKKSEICQKMRAWMYRLMEQDAQHYQEKKGLLPWLLYPQNSNLKYMMKYLRKAEYYCNFSGGWVLKNYLFETAASSGADDGR